VYVLQDGRIADEGRFEDLKRESLLFRELWKHQEDKLKDNC
jgi:ABC-type transport system involved in cytochrome bd biosynthesis fused ATPase/permease subunit